MIVGGEDHRHEIPIHDERSFGKIEEYVKFVLGHDTVYTVQKKWSGPILETIDGLAFIGPYSDAHPHRFVATGFSGNGITYSCISASTFAHHLQGTQSPWVNVYNAKRKIRVRNMYEKAIDYIEELYHGAIKNILGIKKYK